jgi:hypothetical protein
MRPPLQAASVKRQLDSRVWGARPGMRPSAGGYPCEDDQFLCTCGASTKCCAVGDTCTCGGTGCVCALPS